MAITKLKHHDKHQVSIHLCKPQSAHYAALRCVNCNTHIQWLNRQEAQKIKDLGVDLYDYKSVEEFI
jgi:hypothetical protein